MELTIRREQKKDWRAVEELTREAFWNVYVPGCDEHYLMHMMRDLPAFLPELDLVAERDGQLIGHIAYTRVEVRGDDGAVYPAISFGPLSVLPACQKQGVGAALIRHSLETARGLGHGAVLIYGDPAYYHRFGFRPGREFGILRSDGLASEALMALELRKEALSHVSGRFYEDPAFHVDQQAAAEFDKGFRPKEKKQGGPSQERFALLSNPDRQ